MADGSTDTASARLVRTARTQPDTPYDSFGQQRRSASLGMWLFIAQELLFFGGIFVVYVVYRIQHPAAFLDGSRSLDVALGGTNTAVLLGSSFTMALAVRAGALGRSRATALFLVATALLGAAFLGIKGVEYAHKFDAGLWPGGAWTAPTGEAAAAPDALGLFYTLYFAMTGLHGLHVVVGLGLLAALVRPAARGRFTPRDHNLLEGVGLYWHFVDVVWIFLFPLLYLLGRGGTA